MGSRGVVMPRKMCDDSHIWREVSSTAWDLGNTTEGD